MERQTTRERRVRSGGEKGLTGPEARGRLIDLMPVTERRIDLAGIPTAVLEGGDGPPVVLLHGPGEHAAKWFTVVPRLATTYRVIAPDLPGHGASGDGPLDGERVLGWLDALIDRTCPDPPALVGHLLGGAIAARYAALHGGRIERLVLVDALGLAPFRPAPEFGAALGGFLESPGGEAHDRLWERCAFDLDRLRERLGDRWRILRTYNLDRANVPEVRATMQSLMAEFAMAGIPEDELATIEVPTTLVWGRHDLATALTVAEDASAKYGWRLHVIEDAADDPPLEQPEAFLEALRVALEEGESVEGGRGTR